MPAPVGPFAMPALGVALSIPVPPGVWDQVTIDNSSPYTCAVHVSEPRHWLQAYTSDIYTISANGGLVSITPTVALAGGSTDATVTATFYKNTDDIEGSYPIPLTSQAVIAALTVSSLDYLDTIPASFNTVALSGSTTTGVLIPGPPPGMFTRLGIVEMLNTSTTAIANAQIMDGASGTQIAVVFLGPYPSTTQELKPVYQRPGGDNLSGALNCQVSTGSSVIFYVSYKYFNPAAG